MNKNIFWFCDEPPAFEPFTTPLTESFDVNVIIGASVESIQTLRTNPFDLVIVNSEVHTKGVDVNNNSFQTPEFLGVHWFMLGIEFALRIRQGLYIQNGFKPDVPIILLYTIADELESRKSRNEAHPILKDYYQSYEKMSSKERLLAFQTCLITKLKLTALLEIPISLDQFTEAVVKGMSIETTASS